MAKPVHIHEDLARRPPVRGASDRGFGIVFTLVFVVVALWPVGAAIGTSGLEAWRVLNWWAVAVAAAIALVTLWRPALLAPANRAWLRLSLALYRVVNPVIMAVLFFAVVTPFALVMRLAGKDPMRRRLDRTASSYWLERRGESAQSTMKNQF